MLTLTEVPVDEEIEAVTSWDTSNVGISILRLRRVAIEMAGRLLLEEEEEFEGTTTESWTTLSPVVPTDTIIVVEVENVLQCFGESGMASPIKLD